MALAIASPYGNPTSVNHATINASIYASATVFYATAAATATATAINRLTPMPTHTNIIVQRQLTSDVIAGIWVAALCGFLLIIILLGYVARCLAGRLNHMISAGDHHHVGNCCETPHSARGSPAIVENVEAGYSLRDLSGGNGDSRSYPLRDISACKPSDANRIAENPSARDRVATELATGNDNIEIAFVGDQPLGNHPLGSHPPGGYSLEKNI
jgi:hypothetical protein